LRSAGEVYDETIGDNVDEYWSLNWALIFDMLFDKVPLT
jgi:hypothetical protein